jgi:hypothetical protein
MEPLELNPGTLSPSQHAVRNFWLGCKGLGLEVSPADSEQSHDVFGCLPTSFLRAPQLVCIHRTTLAKNSDAARQISERQH